MPLSSFLNLSDPFIGALCAMGWDADPRRRGAVSLDLTDRGAEASAVFLRRGGERIAVVDARGAGFETFPSDTPSALFERYLDLSAIERLVLWALRGESDLLLCLRNDGSTLFDAARETALGRTAAPEPSPGEVAACLRALECEPSQRPAADGERLGEDLKRWFDLLCGVLGPALKWGRAEVERLVRQLSLGLKVLVETRPDLLTDNLVRIGVEIERGNDAVRVRWRPPVPAAFMDEVLSCAAAFAPHGAGAFNEIERGALGRQTADLGEPAARALGEMLQLAAVKFQAAMQIRILPPADREHASWRLALTDPLSVSEKMQSQDLYVFDPLRLDLGECGFGRLLEAVEKLAFWALERDVEVRRAGGHQLDLIEGVPDGLGNERRACDPFNWICRRALRVRVADAYRQAVGFLVATRVLELRIREPFGNYPLAPLSALAAIFESDGEENREREEGR